MKQIKKAYIVLIGLLALTTQASAFQDHTQGRDQGNWTVAQIIDPQSEGDKTLVIIDAGRADGLMNGLLLKGFRPAALRRNFLDVTGKPIVVETGSVKVISVRNEYSIAQVLSEGSLMSKAIYPDFSGLMSGDVLERQRISLVKHKVMTPEKTISYYDLFSDPKGSPENFEMTEEGMALLNDSAEIFGQSRLSLLMVEGYTDHNGPSGRNQIESYQRALTVRQHLIDYLGFDPDRVIAVGYGESEMTDRSMVEGYRRHNRRIVLKVVQDR
jgi:outer membrane protein OmpA-like peptidoglycan-associated protein